MPVTLNIGPPAFGSDGTDPDNPDLFGGYAGHCSKLAPRIYAREAPPGLCPASGVCSLHGEKDCPSLPGFPLKEKTERNPMAEPGEYHPPELPLFFCGYPCTIYEKGCKERYSLNRMTEETLHEERPLFGTENKIFQDLRCYT